MNYKGHIKRACALFAFGALGYIFSRLFQTFVVLLFNIRTARVLQTGFTAWMVLSLAYGGFALVNRQKAIRRRLKDEREIKIQTEKLQSDPLKWLVNDIHEYINQNNSTAFFVEKLETILTQLPRLEKQLINVRAVAAKRFETGSISYSNNIHPIETLYSNLIRLSEDLLQKLNMFDEDKYQSKISVLRAAGRMDDVAEYEKIMGHYTDYANEITDSIEKASVKLDMLILEFAKLSSEQLNDSIEALKALDRIIVNTKLYK